MRFDRYPRPFAFTWTARKAAALRRKQRLEREALPLFALQVAGAQIDEATIRESRRLSWERRQREDRADRAERWRRARRALRALPPAESAACLARWNAAGCPADPGFLGDAVWQVYRRLGLVGDGHAGWLSAYEQAIAALGGRLSP